MGRWLAAVGIGDTKIRNGANVNPQNRQNLHRHSFEGFEGSLTPPSENFLARWDAEDWQVAFEERAAILEFDEGLSQLEAARRARREIEQQRRAKWH